MKQRSRKVILIVTAIIAVMIYSTIDAVPVFADDTSPPPPPAEGPVELPSADNPIDTTSVENAPEEPAAAAPPADKHVDAAPAEVAPKDVLPTDKPIDAAPAQAAPTEEPVELLPADKLIDTPPPAEAPPIEEPAVSPIDEPIDTALVENAPTEEATIAVSTTDEPIDAASVDIASINDASPNSDDLLQPQVTETSTLAAQDQISLDQISEDTTIIVMVDGQIAPLASQDAANAISINDPMWCPTGKLPGDLGCTANYPNVTTLITNLGVMSGPGTIYFTPVYSFNDVSFTHTDVSLTNLGALTIQGGWNGLNNGLGYALSGVTTFSVPVAIDWNNTTVTINDITITGATGTGLTVTSSGDIVLDNVQANGNSGFGAFLDNSAGNGDVTLTGTNAFNNNESDGLRVITKGGITASGGSASGNGGSGASLDNSAGSGKINLHGAGTFNDNADSGLKIFSDGAITLTSISASNNIGGYGAYLNTQGAVTLNGANIFNDNRLDGLYINANGSIVIFNATANSNGGSGLFLQSTANIALHCCTNAANNGGVGVYADLPGTIFLRIGDFSGNGLGEYMVAGGDVRDIEYCALGSGRKVNPNKNVNKPPHKVELISGQTVPLECAAFSGTILILPNGDSVYLPCPIGDKASLSSLAEADLENALPEGTTFTSGFNLQVETDAGSFAIGGKAAFTHMMITISFAIPEGQLGAQALFSWNGSKWVEIMEVVIKDGYITARVNYDGLFILVGK